MATNNNAPTLSILLPVRNEGINIELMVKILSAVLTIPHEILFIYDHPNDDSLPVIRSLSAKKLHVKPVLNKLGRGVINAIKTGVNHAQGKYILLLAVDDVGPTLAIEDMVYLMDKGCDLISCTRYAHGGRRLGGSAVESIVSNVGNKLFRVLCGSVFSDSTTGFKMFRRDIFEKIKLESKPIGWAVVFELAVKAQAQGFKLGEVPIISIDRLYGGKSTFFLGPWVREYIKWFVYGMVHLHNGKKTKLRVRIPKVTAD
jgi:glycosyltransferase involved in cell wall biosynthesis